MRLTATPNKRSRDELKALGSVLSRLQGIGREPGQRRRVAGVILAGFADNFSGESAAGRSWAQLAPATQVDRQSRGYDPRHPILVRTGKYKQTWLDPTHPDHDSLTSVGSDRVVIGEGSADYRAKWHELGTPRMPARPVAPIPPRRVEQLGEVITDLVRAAINGRR